MDTIEKINNFHTENLKSEEVMQLFKTLSRGGEIDGVVIFGAMHIGIKIKQALESFSVNVLCFIDEVEKFDTLDGLKVVHSFADIKEMIASGQSIAFICSAGIVKSLRVMEDRIKGNIPEAKIIDKTALFYAYYKKKIFHNSGVIINAMCTINTNLCTLRCRGCSTMTPLVVPKMRKNFAVDELIKDAEGLSNIADAITYFEILGGEPFLHADLEKHIYRLREIDNIFLLTIVTNGTLLPSQNVLKAMKECDVIVRISDYGDISRNKYELIELLKNWDIVYFMRPANDIPWSDYGEFHNDGGDGRTNWENCRDRGSYVMYNGKLYPCGRIFRQIENGLYDEKLGTYVDIYDDLDRSRLKLKELEHQNIPNYGCRWCGNMENKIEAGVQLP